MVVQTAEQVSKAESLDRIFIAIDDIETYEALKDYGYDLVMTSKDHQSGTDRVAEVIRQLNDVGVVINIQADEPFIDPTLIDRLVEAHSDPTVGMSTLISTQLTAEDQKNDNIVKAILDENNFAIDFKRRATTKYKHLGIYGFTKDTLLKFVSLGQTENEKTRSLEQMRALDNGIKIKAVLTNKDCLSINTLEDLSYMDKESRLQ